MAVSVAVVDIASYTIGDTRSPNSQNLVDERGRRRRGTRGRIPQATITELYREYATRIVQGGDRAFGVSNTGTARRSLERWLAAHQGESIGNVYFVGHGNRFFSWSVRAGPNQQTIHGTPDGQLNSYMAPYFQQGPQLRRDVHSRFMELIASNMTDFSRQHSVEFRACYLTQNTIDASAASMAYGIRSQGGRAARTLRIELRGYSDFYDIIPNSNGGFRSEISNAHGAVASAPGVAAPRAQLWACVQGSQIHLGAACP